MQWMAKSMQALSEETRRLAINERGIYIMEEMEEKAFAFTQEFRGNIYNGRNERGIYIMEEMEEKQED